MKNEAEALKRLANWLTVYRTGLCVSLALIVLRPGLPELGALAVFVAAHLVDAWLARPDYAALAAKVARIANKVGVA